MPLYDLVCILRTSAPRKAIADVLRRAAETVMDANGVVTDITNYGKRDLAYSIKRSGENIVQARGVAAVARLLRPALRPAERGGRQSAGSACGCRCAAPRAAAPLRGQRARADAAWPPVRRGTTCRCRSPRRPRRWPGWST
jgi:ribosomal protein S6